MLAHALAGSDFFLPPKTCKNGAMQPLRADSRTSRQMNPGLRPHLHRCVDANAPTSQHSEDNLHASWAVNTIDQL